MTKEKIHSENHIYYKENNNKSNYKDILTNFWAKMHGNK